MQCKLSCSDCLPVFGIIEADKEHLIRARLYGVRFPLQRHRMQTPILLVWLDRLKYNTFHRQELSVSLGVIIRRYERQLCQTEQVLFCPLSHVKYVTGRVSVVAA